MKIIEKAIEIELSKNPKLDAKELRMTIPIRRCPNEYGMPNKDKCFNMAAQTCTDCFERELEDIDE